MEIAPLLMAAGASLTSCISLVYTKRHTRQLLKLNARTRFANEEMRKTIHERDEIIAHVYTLYNIAKELENVLSSVLSPDYSNVMKYESSHVVYTFDADFELTTDTLHEWQQNPDKCTDYHFALSYSKHPDVISYVYALATLFRWIEMRKTNVTAVRAYHTGQLKDVVESISRFLHSTRDNDLRIPLIRQKGVGRNIYHTEGRKGKPPCNSSKKERIMTGDEFSHRLRSWKYDLPVSFVERRIVQTQSANHRNRRRPRRDYCTYPIIYLRRGRYLITTRRQKDGLMREFRFNDRFSRLIRDTTILFADIVRVKKEFNQVESYGPFIAYAVASRAKRLRQFFTIMVHRKLNRVCQYHRHAHNRICSEQRHRLCCFRRFTKEIIRHRRYSEVKEELCSNPLQSITDIQQFTRRVEGIYKHYLFECYISSIRRDVVLLLAMIRRLVTESDNVIQRDSHFRHNIIQEGHT